MKQYHSLFRMKFLNGLQYRTAALAGISTQFAWGFMEIMAYRAFYTENLADFPMKMQALASYVWLQQAFLAMFASWTFEREILDSITSGSVAYEMCRPMDLYAMWFFRGAGNRLAKALLRCAPILLVAFLLPEPYGIILPDSWSSFFLFLLSMLLAFIVTLAVTTLIYVLTFFTVSSTGITTVMVPLIDFFSGAVIPLAFFPEPLRRIAELLPFASMQNAPYRVYGGDLAGEAMWRAMGLQVFWSVALILLGRCLMKAALKKVVVQGG